MVCNFATSIVTNLVLYGSNSADARQATVTLNGYTSFLLSLVFTVWRLQLNTNLRICFLVSLLPLKPQTCFPSGTQSYEACCKCLSPLRLGGG
jgi:hypothetical protein